MRALKFGCQNMLGWIFKKDKTVATAPASDTLLKTPERAAPATAKPSSNAKPSAKPNVKPSATPNQPPIDWPARLLAAQGNDAELLALLHSTAPLQSKLAAAQAIRSEATLKQAERDTRGQDRRVHSLVKQRHAALLAQRSAQEQAEVLIDTARGLTTQAEVPINQAVALDRAWAALTPELLTESQRSRFAALSAELASQARHRADAAQASARAAAQAQADLQAAADAAALAQQQALALAEEERAAAQAARAAAAAAKQQRQHATKEAQRTQRSENLASVAQSLEHAETALAAGQLAQVHEQLVHIDSALQGQEASENLSPRLAALRASYAQLRGWQHWAGGRARDELTLQAEALATATTTPEAAAALPVKLNTQQRAELINELRERWKALDRSGGATSRALWQRFDAALKTAYEPVAEHVAAQRAAREHNLQLRLNLLQTLEVVVLEEQAPNFKVIATELDHFQREWRKLGPLEHTVPRQQRDAVATRLALATQRLQAPLDEARAAAQQQRESLISSAQALATNTALRGQDLTSAVRQLQNEWQHQAQKLPLARAAENALWGRFKSALDAIFSARDAAHTARLAELKGHAAQRIALIERLNAMAQAMTTAHDPTQESTPPADVKRTLAEVDAAWQRCGPAPREEAAALDQQFHAARDAAVAWLRGSQQRQWLAVCDALQQALQQGAPRTETTLPGAWAQALAQRAAGTQHVHDADDLLLRLEAAWDLPSPPAQAQARRDLRFLQLKSAMEAKSSTTASKPTSTSISGKTSPQAADPTPETPAALLSALIAQPQLHAEQQQRWQAVLQALRDRGPMAIAA
jgi:DNA repair protein SbcC/Rad50